MLCDVHTSGKCIFPLLSCTSHRPSAALSSRLHPSSVLVGCKYSSCFLLLVLVVALFLSFICNSAEFGAQLELAFERIEGGSHHNNLLVVWGFSSVMPMEIIYMDTEDEYKYMVLKIHIFKVHIFKLHILYLKITKIQIFKSIEVSNFFLGLA
jgi:hypothetical protein